MFAIIYRADDRAEIQLRGRWTLDAGAISWQALEAGLEGAPRPLREIGFDCRQLEQWDSRLLTFLLRLREYAQGRAIQFATDGLPVGVQGLLELALTVPEHKGGGEPARPFSLLHTLGEQALEVWNDVLEFTRFVGEWVIALQRLLRGRARFRGGDFAHFLQSAGVDALPIVSLISLLVGAVLAFVGAVQLQLFGAEIYVADLVALGSVREMGAMMTAIIMAGRTGSAYAAQLGTMQVNEEIDALKTLGISPMEFLVLPRSLALILMLPLLCLWADLLGILGGLLVAVGPLHIGLLGYLHETQGAIDLVDVATGLIKALVFAGVIALAGCLRGLQSGRDSAAVGRATTSAMVTAILLIVIWDAITTLIFNRLGV